MLGPPEFAGARAPTAAESRNCLVDTVERMPQCQKPPWFDDAVVLLDEADGATISRTILGTPEYMAPEQAEGHRMLGPGADIYSLGTILYEF